MIQKNSGNWEKENWFEHPGTNIEVTRLEFAYNELYLVTLSPQEKTRYWQINCPADVTKIGYKDCIC